MSDQVTVRFPQHGLGVRDLIWPVALALPLVLTHFLTPVKLHWAVLIIFFLGPAVVALVAMIEWAARKWPQRFSSGICIDDQEIVLARPLRSKITLPFGQIKRIVALSALDAEYGESTTRLAIYTGDRKTTIGGELLYRSSLLERIQYLPGFDSAAYAESDAEEGSVLRNFLSKRTQILKAPS